MRRIFIILIAFIIVMIATSSVMASPNYLIIKTDHFSMLLPGDWKVRNANHEEVNASRNDESAEFNLYETEFGGLDLNVELALSLVEQTLVQNGSMYNYVGENREYKGQLIHTFHAADKSGNKMLGCVIYTNGYVVITYYSEGIITSDDKLETVLGYVSTLQLDNNHVFVIEDETITAQVDNKTKQDIDTKIKDNQFDIEQATDEELNIEIERLTSEKIKRAKKKIPATGELEDGSIVFRGVPWYSTRKETERIIGFTSSTTGPNDIYRMEAIDYDSVTTGSERVDDLGGCKAYYSGISIGGLKPSSTYICYLYPIVDGNIIRDDDISEMYFGFYKFSRGDFGDYGAIYNELHRKLSDTYGKAYDEQDNYHFRSKWKDRYGNYIELIMTDDKDYVALGYIAADADIRLDEMIVAIQNEKAVQELLEQKINEDNYDGL